MKRDPTGSALHRHDLQLGEAIEHPRADDVHHHPSISDEKKCASDGELGVIVVGLPWVRTEVAHSRQACADVEWTGIDNVLHASKVGPKRGSPSQERRGPAGRCQVHSA